MAHVVCRVQFQADQAAFTWSEGPAAFPPYAVRERFDEFTDRAAAALDRLRDIVVLHQQGDEADAGEAGLHLARTGHQLHELIFHSGGDSDDRVAGAVRTWLDRLAAQGAVEALELVADGGPQVPWNLVYDRPPDEAAFLTGTGVDHWRPFWGLRYTLSVGRSVEPLRRLPVLEAPRVLVVTAPDVVDGLPAGVRAELAALAAAHGWTVARSKAEVTAARAAGRPDVLYWLGHTEADGTLVLEEDKYRPEDLAKLLTRDGPAADDVVGGVVFLNACGTAQAGKAGSFLKALHRLRLSGVVATEAETLDTFAGPAGLTFLKEFVAGGRPIGPVLRDLRGRVPLGLLYGSYCPPHIRVVPAGTGAGPEAAVAPVAPAGGKSLRRPDPAREPARHPLPDKPYRSFLYFTPRDRALFAGREEDTARFCRLLDDPGTKVLVLHGESGVGKTSFLRAGVIPYLEDECVGYKFARARAADGAEPVLFVRATNDLPGQLASALAAYCARPLTYPSPDGSDARADLPAVLGTAGNGPIDTSSLRAALRADPDLLGRALGAVAAVLPFRPVLIVDQAEEVFTLAKTADDAESRKLGLEMLRRAGSADGPFKIIVSLRTEYHGRLTDRLRLGRADVSGVRDYLLTDFDAAALAEAIRRPTAEEPIPFAAEVPFAKYGFRYAAGVAEQIAAEVLAHTTNRQDSALPLLQVLCTQLYELAHARPDRTATAADLAAIGGVAGGMKRHAEALVGRLFPTRGDQSAFKRLLSDDETQLFLRQADGTLTTALLPADHLRAHWRGRMPFDEMVRAAGGGDWRLLRVNTLRIGADGAERAYVSLGHDALAPVVADWNRETVRAARVRRWAALATAAVALAGVMTALSVFAWLKARDARASAGQAENALGEANEARGRAEVAEQDALEGEQRTKRQLAETVIFEGILPLRRSSTRRVVSAPETVFWGAFDLFRAVGRSPVPALLGVHLVSSEYLVPVGYVAVAPSFPRALSADGRWSVVATREGGFAVRDTVTGLTRSPVRGRDAQSEVIDLRLSEDGRVAVVARKDGSVGAWDIRSLAEIRRIPARPGAARRIHAVSADGGHVLLAGGPEPGWMVWETLTGRTVSITPGPGPRPPTARVALSPDGRRVAVGTADGKIRLFDAATGAETPGIEQTPGRVAALVFFPDSRLVVSNAAAPNGPITCWDTVTRSARWSKPEATGLADLVVTADGRLLISATDAGGVTVRDAVTGIRMGDRLKTGYLDPMLADSTVIADGGWLISAVPSRDANCWDISAGTKDQRFAWHTQAVTAVAVTGDGRLVACGCADGSADVWDVLTGLRTGVLRPGHGGPVKSIALSAAGDTVGTCGADGVVRVWDTAAGKVRWTGPAGTTGVTAVAVAVSADGRTVLFGDSVGRV
ncbi:MAG TPA: hypothetical protein VM597_04810, partial [Gemmataceae bacterium]|nr:hypothetical protein [Gemmataceae bacterium]